MADVTPLFSTYRECVRHLWNVYFRPIAEPTPNWGSSAKSVGDRRGGGWRGAAAVLAAVKRAGCIKPDARVDAGVPPWIYTSCPLDLRCGRPREGVSRAASQKRPGLGAWRANRVLGAARCSRCPTARGRSPLGRSPTWPLGHLADGAGGLRWNVFTRRNSNHLTPSNSHSRPFCAACKTSPASSSPRCG